MSANGGWWRVCLILATLVEASPTPSMDMATHLVRNIQDIRVRQNAGNGSTSGGGNNARTTIIFATVIGSVLAIFITFTVVNILRSKYGWRMPTIPMPDPPSYLSALRFGRRNPEDVGPPLPEYMEQPDGSTTVLQRSESRRTRGQRTPPRSDSPAEVENRPAGVQVVPLPLLLRGATLPVTDPPPYMKDPRLVPDSPLSPSTSIPLPLLPPPSHDERMREVRRSRSY